MENRNGMKQNTQRRTDVEQIVHDKLGATIMLLLVDENEKALSAAFAAVRACVDFLSPMQEYDGEALDMFNDACMMMECAVSSLNGADVEQRVHAEGAGMFGGLLERIEQLPENDMSRNLSAAFLYYMLYFDEDNLDIERCYGLMQKVQESGNYGLRPVMFCNVLMEMGMRCAESDPAGAEEYLRRAYKVTYAACRLHGERLQQCRARAMLAKMLAELCSQEDRPVAGLRWKMKAFAAQGPIVMAKAGVQLSNAASSIREAAGKAIGKAIGSLRPDALAFAMMATTLFALTRALIR